MQIFQSEKDVRQKLTEHFIYAKEFALNNITYNDFYFVYALEGHESDEEEKALLLKYKNKVYFHEVVTSILSQICSDEDALKEIYKKSGRYNSETARNKIYNLISEYDSEYK